MSPSKILLIASLVLTSNVQAQAPAAAVSTSGTMIIVPAVGEVSHANDEATITFAVEEHDKDKNAAAARVNQKMKQGTEIVRRADPTAELKTQGYYTYPVYPELPPRPMGSAPVTPVPAAWRVGQYLQVKTRNLATLPKTAAAAQKVLSINNLDFGLTRETAKLLDDRRIAETYRNLNERIASIARAMGRSPADAVLDTVDFEGSGHYAGQMAEAAPMASMRMAKDQSQAMPEPSFEPGETTLQMRLVGKVKFK
ncbi:MAG TPA: SIMPL domain-containing protein [Telluria sp.]